MDLLRGNSGAFYYSIWGGKINKKSMCMSTPKFAKKKRKRKRLF
jgi:hypothetical protein